MLCCSLRKVRLHTFSKQSCLERFANHLDDLPGVYFPVPFSQRLFPSAYFPVSISQCLFPSSLFPVPFSQRLFSQRFANHLDDLPSVGHFWCTILMCNSTSSFSRQSQRQQLHLTYNLRNYLKSESDSLFSNLIMKALKAIKGFEMIISIQLDLLQEQLSVSVIEVKTSLTELKVYFCAFHMWGNHTLPAIGFGLDNFRLEKFRKSKFMQKCNFLLLWICSARMTISKEV